MQEDKFKIDLTETVKRKVEYSRHLCPEDFLDCKDLSILKYEIEHKLKYEDNLTEDRHYIKNPKYDYDIFDVIRRDLKIPEKFISRWKELLGMKPCQVVNPKHAEELKKRADKIEEISGCDLNARLCSSFYREYHLAEVYHQVHFNEEEIYKCYVVYDDHDWSAPTQTNVIYIEGF